jgi:hypothetical protein
MRCPYCGGLNPDKNTYCTYCGRDMRPPARPAAGQYPPVQQPRPTSSVPPAQQARPVLSPQTPSHSPKPAQPPLSMLPGQSAQPMRAPAQGQVTSPAPTTARTAPPEAPAPFPPRSLEELQALEPGALEYTALESESGAGRKKTVRILFPKCAAWQQVATLLKALKEQQDEQFERIIIQGQQDRGASVYSFTNGQLVFDRNVRLGAAITNRYQIETGNGFDSDAVRIVLSADK